MLTRLEAALGDNSGRVEGRLSIESPIYDNEATICTPHLTP